MSYGPFHCFLVLLLLCAVASSTELPLYSVLFVTPSPYLDSFLVNSSSLSSLGFRQSYLLGRELRYSYIERLQLNPRDIYAVASKFPQNVQTLSGILMGLFLSGSGPLLGSKTLQTKSVPPGTGYNFTNWSAELRDASLPYYSEAFSNRGLISEPDFLFSADKACPSFYGRAQATLSHNECQSDSTTFKACQELYKACLNYTYEKITDKNVTDETTCKCLEIVRSAQWHSIYPYANVSKEAMDILSRTVCDNFTEKILESRYNSDQVKIVTEELLKDVTNNIKLGIESHKWGMTMYAVSELQMKALLFSLTEEFPTRLPKYGTMVQLEVFPANSNETYMQLLVNKKPVLVHKNKMMNYTTFIRTVEENMLPNYHSACYIVPPPVEEKSTFNILLTLSIASGAAFILLVMLVVLCIVRKRYGRGAEGSLLEPEDTKKISMVSGQPEVAIVEEMEDNLDSPHLRINQSAFKESNKGSNVSYMREHEEIPEEFKGEEGNFTLKENRKRKDMSEIKRLKESINEGDEDPSYD